MISLNSYIVTKFPQTLEQPLVIALSSVGLLANILCLTVRTLPRFRSRFNTLLIYLILVDVLGLGTSLVAELNNLRLGHHRTYSWLDFLLHQTLLSLSSLLVHRLNMWLTLVITVTRYVVISSVTRRLETKHVRMSFLAALVVSVAQSVSPSITCYTRGMVDRVDGNKTSFLIDVDLVDLPFDYHSGLLGGSNLGHHVDYVMNIIACACLLIFSFLIMSVLYRGKKQHDQITSSSNRSQTWRSTNKTSLIVLSIALMSIFSKTLLVIEAVATLSSISAPVIFHEIFYF